MKGVVRKLVLGEFRRSVDERHRVSIPPELLGAAGTDGDGEAEASAGSSAAARAAAADSAASGSSSESAEWILAKERPGCLSLWQAAAWQDYLDAGVRVVESKLQAGRLGDRLAQVQTLGRLLSTRHRSVKLAGRGRLAIPEGFREFLGVEPNTEVMLIGAAICIEIWRLDAWLACLNDQIPQFGSLLDELSG